MTESRGADLTCMEVDDLLAAYALDAVDDDERAAIEAHLATCDLHAEAADWRVAATGLGLLTEEREPSAAARDRLLAALDPSEAREAPAQPERVQPERVLPERVERGRRVLAMRWPAALAAAVVLAAVGFGAGAMALGPGLLGGDDPDMMMVQVVQRDGASMRAEAAMGEMPVKVTLAGLRRLPEDEGYQVWAVREEGWMPVGMCNTDADGWWEGDFAFALQRDDALAVTVEPRSGSTTPSGEVVLMGSPGGDASVGGASDGGAWE